MGKKLSAGFEHHQGPVRQRWVFSCSWDGHGPPGAGSGTHGMGEGWRRAAEIQKFIPAGGVEPWVLQLGISWVPAQRGEWHTRAFHGKGAPPGKEHPELDGTSHPHPLPALWVCPWEQLEEIPALPALGLWLCCAGSARPRRSQSLPIWSPCTAHADEAGAASEELYQDFLF